MEVDLLVSNGVVVTYGEKPRIIENGYVAIRDGRIISMGKSSECPFDTAEKVIDCSGKLVLPGLINAHHHFYSSFARGLGKAAPADNFVEVLQNLWWRLDRQLNAEDVRLSAEAAVLEAIRYGCTTIVDHHASPGSVRGSLQSIAEVTQAAGIRASLCYEVSDRDGADIAKAGLEENASFLKDLASIKSEHLHGLFGLHAAFTVGDETLKKAVDLAASTNAGFHIHVAEDKADQDHSLKEHGMRVVERLSKFGVLGSNTICAHCVHVDDHERKLLADSKTIVTHQPQSNMNNAVGTMPLKDTLDAGVLVGLGTDAMTNNMLEELRSCLWIHKAVAGNPSVAFGEALEVFFNNAAIASRFFGRGIGTLTEGGPADLIVVDYDPITPFGLDNFGGHLIFGISQSLVDTTICAGKVLMEEKEIKTMDAAAIAERSRIASAAMWDRF